MSRYWSDTVRNLTPYIPGEQPALHNLIKLNTNENPYGPSPEALAAIRRAADDALRLYPDPEARQLRTVLADHLQVGAENIFVGNGSDEVLAHAFAALLKHDLPLWMPDITYSFYPVYCRLYGIDYQQIPLDADFTLRTEDYLPSEGNTAGAIIFANPNAPTGCFLAVSDIERIVLANPQAVVVIDEAYVDFGAESAVPLTKRYPNLLVVQTFSKSRALAGLRVGFAVGNIELIEALKRIKNSFNSYPLGRPAQAGATASIEDDRHFREGCARVIATRETLSRDLATLGFQVLPSMANFVFARHPGHDGASLAARLRERAILVRHFKIAGIEHFLRISIGTDAQCDTLVQALREIVHL